MNKQYTDEEIRQQVTNFYDNIAVGKTSTEVNSIDLYKSLGYDPKLLEKSLKKCHQDYLVEIHLIT